MNTIKKTSETFNLARSWAVLGLTALVTLASLRAQAQSMPVRVNATELNTYPYAFSGVIWNSTWRGSGTVARHPKIAVSCAHVVFDNGTWLKGHNWANRYYSASHPAGSANEKFLRGYHYWTSYAAKKWNEDFVVHYNYSTLAGNGYAGTWYMDNETLKQWHPLKNPLYSIRKRIVGYPGSDGFFMNATGPFTSTFSTRNFAMPYYLWNASVGVRSGMSGGGVFCESYQDWPLTGVTVSNDGDGNLGTGVRALDSNANNLMTSAISSAEATRPVTLLFPFFGFPGVSIPDNNLTWTERTVTVAGMPRKTTGVIFSLQVTHPYIGDLEVNITSPSGRPLLVHNRTGGSQDNLIISNKDVSSSFNGFDPNGVWKVSVRDRAAADVGTLDFFSFIITSE